MLPTLFVATNARLTNKNNKSNAESSFVSVKHLLADTRWHSAMANTNIDNDIIATLMKHKRSLVTYCMEK